MEKTTYSVKVVCTNCNWADEVELPYEVAVSETPCPNCRVYGRLLLDSTKQPKTNEIQ
jgi:hypothetical protein